MPPRHPPAQSAVIQQLQSRKSKDEVVADDGVLKRVMASDRTLLPADYEKLYVSGANTAYIKDFEFVAEQRPIVIRFRSDDQWL
jgi:hypothetical protein